MSEIEVQEWIKLANHDIDTADLLIKEKGHADIIIYHLHQAIEKLLKALLIKSGKSYEKTHYLDRLLTESISIYPELSQIRDAVLEINLYLPKLRYPYGDVIEFDEAIGLYKKFKLAKEILLKLLT